MTIREISMEEVSKSVREMTEEASRVAMEAVEMAIADVHKAAEAALATSQQATSRAEEIGISIRIIAEEAKRTARQAVETVIMEVNKAAEAAQNESQQAASQAVKIAESTREWAEEARKSVKETTEKAIKDATRTVETAEAVAQQMVSRTEEFSKSAKQMAEEAARAAKEASEIAIKEATNAAVTTKEALRQAANRAEEVSNLAKDLAEQATRSAKEAAESAKRAFEESIARSIERAEKARMVSQFQGVRMSEAESLAVGQKGKLIDNQTKTTHCNGNNGKTAGQPIEESPIVEAKQVTQSPGLAVATDSLGNSLETRENQDKKESKPVETHDSLKNEAERQARVTEEEINKMAAMIAQKARKEAEEAKQAELEVEERVKQLADEAKKITKSEEKVRNQPELEDNGKKCSGAEKQEIWQGTVRIALSSNGLVQLRDFEQQLRRLENIKVLWSGGSDSEGPNIVVSLQKPISLIKTLSELPMVKGAAKEGQQIRVTL